MKGTYILLIHLPCSHSLLVGGLGKIDLEKGYYAYVGSALNSLETRVKRHLKNKTRLYWHIDYLLDKARVKEVFYKEGEKKEECDFVDRLKTRFQSINGFGSSDCKCKSHLFYSKSYSRLKSSITRLGTNRYEV